MKSFDEKKTKEKKRDYEENCAKNKKPFEKHKTEHAHIHKK